ncbi:MAG: UPF0182 family protein [Firmicutes bacterium]|nr:UPF0182 family protein [Bacillota bacterium]
MNGQAKFERKISIVLAVLIVAVVLFLALIQFITDFMWFKEMGYVDVFLKELTTQLKVGVPTMIVVAALLQIYLTHLRKSYFAKIASSEETDMKNLKKITWLLAIVAGAIASFTAVSQLWFEILKFANSTSFDITDPLFNVDISFYIFKLEFLKQLNEILIGVIIGFVVLTLVYYIILMTVRTPDMFKEEPAQEAWQAQQEEDTYSQSSEERFSGSSNPFGHNPFGGNGGQKANDPFSKFAEAFGGHAKKSAPKPRKQFDDGNFKQLLQIASGKISVLGLIFFLMLAINFFLRQFDLLQAHTGAVYGAGFTDVNITLWMLRILCVLAVLAGIMFVVNMKKKKYTKILTIPVIMIVIGLAGTGASYLIQNFVVSPDEINKESKYLDWNIQYTQLAYQLDDVDVKSFAADNSLTASDITDNAETINNIRINDFDPAKQFYNQTQSIRQYYTFADVDVDRYMINGKYTQTFLTTREIDEAKITDTWLNRHIKYTHGYGIALSRVDKVTASGQPDVLIGNIPPVSEVAEITIDRPEVYFGELSNEYIIVGTDEQEFDYPDGDSNKYTYYEGDAGIELNFFNRILFSIREGSMKLFTSSNIDGDSKIIINRNVMQRVRQIMPFLAYENDPYMVTADGKLYWMVDAYTMSSYYPYSEPYGDFNYIRNSVKVVVDAYNGDVSFYVVDEEDPIAATFAKIYPTLFKEFDQMPESLKSHMRYPNNLFQVQASVYGKYHMEDVNVFYQSEDAWDIAYEIYGMEKKQMEPNYYIAKLPGEEKAEFFNSIPFTPKSKQNMTALMVARNDGDAYGQLVLYQFPKGRTIYGPEQIEAQIDQNTEISKEFSLWNSSGTQYRRGNLFVIPINTSLLYVEPVYLEAANSSIPEVKRIIMAYDDEIAYEETLAECLVELFGDDAEDGVGGEATDQPQGGDGEGGEAEKPDTMSQTELIEAAAAAYENAIEAQKEGDWAGYGEYMEELEKYLNELAN